MVQEGAGTICRTARLLEADASYGVVRHLLDSLKSVGEEISALRW